MVPMSVQTVKNKSLIIGLTGGIASGKTTAAELFNQAGIKVIDSDEIVSHLWNSDQSMILEIEDTFGYPMTKEGKKRLTKEIFQDDYKRAQLNRIIHPKVFKKIEEQKNQYACEDIVVVDMPLLIEVGYQKDVDTVVLVYVDKDTQLERLIARDHLSKEDAYMRINSQMSMEEKKSYADVILDNTKDIKDLEKDIHDFIEKIKHEK